MSTEEQINKYRNLALGFIQNNKIDLARIYLRHKQTDGDGVLGVNLEEVEEKQNIDVSYIPMNILPEAYVAIVNERKGANNENIIYILLITPAEEKILEMDIRTLAM